MTTPSPSLPSARHSRTRAVTLSRQTEQERRFSRVITIGWMTGVPSLIFHSFSNHHNLSFHKQETMTASLAASQAMAAAASTTAASASSSENTATNPQQQQQQQRRSHRKLLLPFRRRGGGVVDITNTAASLAQTQCIHGELQILPTMSAESKSSEESTTVACNRGTGRRRFHNPSRLYKERSTCSLLFALLPEFVPKFVLEVLGGAGAIWGFSEACGLRRPTTIWFWRPAALCIGFLFFLRFLHQFYCKIQQLQRQQATPVSYYRDLELGESTSSSPVPPPVDTTMLELTPGAPSTTTTTTGSIDSFQEPPPTLSSTNMMILEERPLSPPTTEWTSLTGAAASAQQAASGATLSPLDPLPHRRTLTR